jgi:uncharacterized protein (TIGR00159 family)
VSFNILGSPFLSFFWLTQVFDILFLTVIVWFLLRSIWNQPAMRVVIAVAVFVILAVVLQQMRFHAMGRILEEAAKILPVALIVIFHEEIKDLLSRFGRYLQEMEFLNRSRPGQIQDVFIENLVVTCATLSRKGMGALIVLERDEDLTRFCSDYHPLPGIEFVPILVEAILTSPGPLHDGAMVIRGRKIIMAHAFLPMHVGLEGFGGRHRAGLGISERTDAIAVLVSEETGACRLAIKGVLSASLSDRGLKRRLYNLFYPNQSGRKSEREGT